MKAALAALALAAAACGCTRTATQARTCPGPRAGWLTPAQGTPHLAMINRVTLSRAGVLHWNGAPIDRATLRRYMRIVATMNPPPFTTFAPDPAVDCALLEAVRDDMAASGGCAAGGGGGCGEGHGPWALQSDGAVPPTGDDHSAAANAMREIEAAADEAANTATAQAR